MTRISKEWRFYRFFGASLVKRFSDTRYQALATYGIIDIWRKALRFLTPFPHGVMAAHGSLEPFVLVRVQVGELEGDMRRHVVMSPHIFYQIRSAVLSIIRFPRRRTFHRPYGTCVGWTVEYLAVGQANAVFFGYVRRGGYAGIPAFQHVSACEDPPLADQNRWHSVRARFGLYPDCVEACITCSPAIGICPHLQCGIDKHHNAAVENHKIRRTGIPGRDAPGRCRTVPRRNRLRTRRGWRWLAAARWKGRSGRPSASLPESERYQ